MARPGMLLCCCAAALLAAWWGTANASLSSPPTGAPLEDEAENQENILSQVRLAWKPSELGRGSRTLEVISQRRIRNDGEWTAGVPKVLLKCTDSSLTLASLMAPKNPKPKPTTRNASEHVQKVLHN